MAAPQDSRQGEAGEPILVRVAADLIEHLSAKDSEPVVIVGIESHDDGTYDLVLRSRPDVAALRRALQETEKGYGSLLWALNNAHNAHTEMWKQIANSAENDGRAALTAIREALR